jgi:hypothetical protein
VSYLRERGEQLGEPSKGDPDRGEPDALCESPSGLVGIEIACAYYDGRDAKSSWDIPRGKSKGGELGPVYRNPDQMLGRELKRVLLKHDRKPYSVPTYLVLDAAAPAHAAITMASDADVLLADLRLPYASHFLTAFLLLTDEASGRPVYFELPREERATSPDPSRH